MKGPYKWTLSKRPILERAWTVHPDWPDGIWPRPRSVASSLVAARKRVGAHNSQTLDATATCGECVDVPRGRLGAMPSEDDGRSALTAGVGTRRLPRSTRLRTD